MNGQANSAMVGRRRVGLDLDGVIIDHAASKISLAAALGFTLERWQTNTNVFAKLVGRAGYKSVEARLYGELTETAAPVAGALEHLAALPDDTCIVSARGDEMRDVAWRWLENNGVTSVIPVERILFVGSGHDKPRELLRLGITDYLDDKLSVLRSLPPGVRRVLFDEYSLAAQLALSPDIEAVSGWAEFIRLLAA